AYPDLKANQNFLQLQDQLQRIEEEIAGSRRYYNGVVNRFNTKTEMFPGNIIAGIFGFQRKPLYEVNDSGERENVKVTF
ncbi:MAG: LemA family protein, partial [Muricomes sp.]|nr:LemA family protein [Muricomes sp.]